MAKYRKGKQINAGGFGVLYEGICVDDNTPCVLKYLKPDYDEDDLRRFKREVRLQTQLQHPNITPIVASNLDAEPPWFVMPKAAMNLRQFVSGGWMDDALHVFKSTSTRFTSSVYTQGKGPFRGGLGLLWTFQGVLSRSCSFPT